jgi:ATP-dependent DNA helicase RecG
MQESNLQHLDLTCMVYNRTLLSNFFPSLPMTPRAELSEAIALGESEIMEWKASTGQRTDGAKTICAFANARGGRVVFGIDPDGIQAGQKIGEETLEDITQEIRKIEPPLYPTIETFPVEQDRSLIVVTCERGHLQPYTYHGTAYRRVGTTNQILSLPERDRMLMERLHAQRRWENESAGDITIEALDAAEITRTLDEAIRRGRIGEPGTRDPLMVLRGMGLMQDDQMLRAAMVLFGKADAFLPHYPQCLIKLARFRGTERSEFIDNRQYHGNAFTLLKQGEAFLREHLPIAGRIVPNLFEREDDPLYPPAALREALANAICHRDYAVGGGSVSIGIYDDRLEIISSGPLPFGITPEKLFLEHESRPWNPLIAHVFFLRGIIERWGRGTLKIAELTQQAGFVRPTIEERDQHVVVTFMPKKAPPPRTVQSELLPIERKIVQFLSEEGPHPRREIVRAIGGNRETVGAALVRLLQLGVVHKDGYGKGTQWSVHSS